MQSIDGDNMASKRGRVEHPAQTSFDYLFWDGPRPRPAIAGGMSLDDDVRGVLRDAIKASSISRQQIAERITDLTGRKVTSAHLDAWTGQTRKGWQVPIHIIPALEATLGEPIFTRWLAEMRGGRLIEGEEIDLMNLGIVEAEKAKLRSVRRKINKRIG